MLYLFTKAGCQCRGHILQTHCKKIKKTIFIVTKLVKKINEIFNPKIGAATKTKVKHMEIFNKKEKNTLLIVSGGEPLFNQNVRRQYKAKLTKKIRKAAYINIF